MENSYAIVKRALEFAVKNNQSDEVINKILSLMREHLGLVGSCFYWDFNKSFYFSVAHKKNQKILAGVKKKLTQLSFKGADHYFEQNVSETERMPVLYLPIVDVYHAHGVVGLFFAAEDKKKVIGKLDFIWALVHELSLSLTQAIFLYKTKEHKHEAISGIIAVIEALDPYIRDHSKNVANYALLLAEELRLPPQTIEEIYYGALFHDIGKIGIPVNILRKKSALNDDEYALIKNHPQVGVKILDQFTDFKIIVPTVLHHHEMYGGGGYPNGLKGDQIPFSARLVAVVDAYDAITTNRSYRKAQRGKTAIEVIKKNTPQQFDPTIVKAFVNVEKNL